MKTITENEKEYGSVTYKGIEYILTQQAYVGNYGTDGGVRYYASGINPATGDRVIVAWDTTPEWDKLCEDCNRYDSISQSIGNIHYQSEDELAKLESELAELKAEYDGSVPDIDLLNDESDACNWDNPVDVEIVD